MDSPSHILGTRRSWSHRSALGLLYESQLGETPADVVRRKAQNLVQRAIQHGWAGPPFDVRLLANLLGIKATATSTILAEAQIVPIGGQFELLFREDVSSNRLNFTFAHEISHTLFPDCGEMIHERNSGNRSFDPNREVERLCDIAAAEILMPFPYFEDDVAYLGANLASAQILSKRYRASREAVILRMVSSTAKQCAVLYLRSGQNLDELEAIRNHPELSKSIRPRLRIGPAIVSRTFDLSLPWNKSIPDDSVIYDLFNGKNHVSEFEQWNIRGFQTRLVEGLRLYRKDATGKPGIIAMIN